MSRFKLGLQLYSVRDEMEKDMDATLKAVAEMGYDCVEFAGYFDHTAEEVKAMCEKYGLEPVSVHQGHSVFLDDPENSVNYLKTLGVKYCAIPHVSPERWKEEYDVLIDEIKKVGKLLKDNGIKLMYHNHDFEFKKIDGEYALDILYKEVSPDLLQTQLDTCWVNVGGENPAEYVKKYAGRIPTVHLKDFAGSKSEKMYALIGIDDDKKTETKGTFEFRPLGKGLQDFKSIVKAADEGGAEWFIVEQDSPSMGYTPLECAKISVEYLLSEIAE